MNGCKQMLALMLAVVIGLSGLFNPSIVEAGQNQNQPVEKGEFIKQLVNTLGIDLQDGEIPFTDVDAELKPYLEAAIRTNILDDTSGSTFGPNEKVTREQAYVFLIRSLNLRDSYSIDSLKAFRDFKAINSEYHQELSAAAELGLIPSSQPTFQPKKPVTHLELKAMLSTYETNFEFVSVIHSNDLHGRIMHNETNQELGLAKISELANQARSKNPTLLVDLGDTFHGTNYVNFNQGLAAVDAMNEMKYDAMVPGNHDFNYGQDYLLELKDKLDFPLVSANILKDDDPFLDGYTIVERNGKEIALVGLTATDTAVKTNPAGIEGITFLDEVTVAKQLVAELENEVDAIVAISHSGLDTDVNIANEVNGIDVIFGGHSHDTIETPIKYTHGYVTQANEYGKALGHTNLIFHNDNLIGVNGFLYRDHADKTEDPSVTAILDEYKEEVDQELNVVIATTDVQLDGERTDVRTKETNLGNLITDAMRAELGTDIALTNGGGIRASIQPGEVTRNDVFTTLPFDNTLVSTTLTGDEILAALEHSVRLYPAENGGFLHVSGLSFSFDPAKPAGSRVGEVLVNGEQLDLVKSYSVATNNFTAAGGDGFEMFNVDNIEFDSGELLSTILINALQSNNSIPEVEGRIVVK
ncbi:5'-nucleotidase C-terminal domain-containing protein [Alkalihalophilus lindianensis]|uniref:5'-nucleotidase C-terminal domain-containing protein n=1 Tax=Alkalihalophilus lindianensis TaxID=1630542 RepID=A0ABU3X4Q0_9BACI|nr:5'-nucleotidase C-terminal domain-containing protein [Alkalihalophilus lindianensis]MDV2682871.1 5'-nucleotidase C-terminal domain-containing protein [Alkalihalophilus lindianensis]